MGEESLPVDRITQCRNYDFSGERERESRGRVNERERDGVRGRGKERGIEMRRVGGMSRRKTKKE